MQMLLMEYMELSNDQESGQESLKSIETADAEACM
jgi:hypothetical protein